MKVFLAVSLATLLLAPGLALADTNSAARDSASAMIDDYIPGELEISFDQLVDSGDLLADPNPILIEQLAPDVLQRAQADVGDDVFDDFGDFDDTAPADAAPVADAPAAPDAPMADAVAPAPDMPAPAEPIIPEGWTRYEKLGLSFATPAGFAVSKDRDDRFQMDLIEDRANHIGCAVMGMIDRPQKPEDNMPDGASVTALPDRTLAFGTAFSVWNVDAAYQGIEIRAMLMQSKEQYREQDHLALIISCTGKSGEDAEALFSGVLGSVQLVDAPMGENDMSRLGGLVSAELPEGWTSYRSNETDWLVFGPSMQATVTFETGDKALTSLGALSPERRDAIFAEAPVIRRATPPHENGWLVSGDIAPDDPERGIYNGGMEGPTSYFIADRCLPSGDALIWVTRAPRGWTESGNSFDVFLDTVSLDWPDGPQACSDEVAKAISEATGAGMPDVASTPQTPDAATAPPADKAADPPANNAVADASGEWARYTGPLHGTTISYPAENIVIESEKADGSGRTFVTIDGALTFKVDGMVNDQNFDIDGILREVLAVANPDFVMTGMQRLGDNSLRVDSTHDGRNGIDIWKIDDKNILHWFTSMFTDRYAGLAEQIADTFGIIEPEPQKPVAGSAQSDNTAIELAFWDAIKDSSDPADFQAYLDQFPNGSFATLARNRLMRLTPAQPVPGPNGVDATTGTDQSTGKSGIGTAPTQQVADNLVAQALSPQGAVDYAGDHDWTYYYNDRYGTSIEYPADIFVPQAPPTNNDGRQFVSRDGRSGFHVFAQYNALQMSLAELYSEDQTRTDEEVVFQELWSGSNGFVVSGLRASEVFYRETMLSGDGLIEVFEVTYSYDLVDAFDPILERMSYSFPGSATGSGAAAGTGAAVPNPSPSSSPSDYYTPARGTTERKAIMDAARGPVSNDIGQTVIFVAKVLNSDGHWAYLQAKPVQPNGKPLNWNKTRYAADWQADVMSDTVMVLLAKQNGQWQTVDHIVGPTDVFWYGWIDQYGLPQALFGG